MVVRYTVHGRGRFQFAPERILTQGAVATALGVVCQIGMGSDATGRRTRQAGQRGTGARRHGYSEKRTSSLPGIVAAGFRHLYGLI